MSCPCENKPKKNITDQQAATFSPQPQMTYSELSVPRNFCKFKNNNKQIKEETQYLDEFLRNFAINNEYDEQTGLLKTHGIPSAYIDWCPKDTLKEQTIPNKPYIKWEIKSGYLIVRDTRIQGDRNLCVEEGGQIVIKRNFTIPICALSSGYPADWLVGLADKLTEYFDNKTIVRDKQTNKFTVKEKKQKLQFFIDRDKTSLLFEYDEVGDFYYLVDGALDYKIAVKTDNKTIKGDGKNIPLQKK